MAEIEGTMGSRARIAGTDWPASRVCAMIGGVLGFLMAVLLLIGAGAGVNVSNVGSLPYTSGSVLGAVGVGHLVLSVLVLGSAWLLPDNPRLHGGLLIVWGIIGLFVGFGLWIGALLALVGGILALVQRPTGMAGGRRPVV